MISLHHGPFLWPESAPSDVVMKRRKVTTIICKPGTAINAKQFSTVGCREHLCKVSGAFLWGCQCLRRTWDACTLLKSLMWPTYTVCFDQIKVFAITTVQRTQDCKFKTRFSLLLSNSVCCLNNGIQRRLVVSLCQHCTGSTTGSLVALRREHTDWRGPWCVSLSEAVFLVYAFFSPKTSPHPQERHTGLNSGEGFMWEWGGGITTHWLPSFQKSRKSLLGYNIFSLITRLWKTV